MVHAIERPHPDAKRIAGYAVAITFNALLLMLILTPVQVPQGFRLPQAPQASIRWYAPDKPVPPPVVPILPPRADPQPPRIAAERAPQPQPPVPVLVDAGSVAPPIASNAVEQPTVDIPAIAAPDPAPVAGVRQQYLRAPPPAYPRAAARAGVEGTVLLQVLVGVDGRPLQVDVRQGSGDRRLDASAREQVLRHWRFRPAMREGRAVQAIGLVPVAFNLGQAR